MKIGVGALRKVDDSRYSGYAHYDIVDAGKWSVQQSPTEVETLQELNDPGSATATSTAR